VDEALRSHGRAHVAERPELRAAVKRIDPSLAAPAITLLRAAA
jgi:hypothetical protein